MVEIPRACCVALLRRQVSWLTMRWDHVSLTFELNRKCKIPHLLEKKPGATETCPVGSRQIGKFRALHPWIPVMKLLTTWFTLVHIGSPCSMFLFTATTRYHLLPILPLFAVFLPGRTFDHFLEPGWAGWRWQWTSGHWSWTWLDSIREILSKSFQGICGYAASYELVPMKWMEASKRFRKIHKTVEKYFDILFYQKNGKKGIWRWQGQGHVGAAVAPRPGRGGCDPSLGCVIFDYTGYHQLSPAISLLRLPAISQ